MISQQQIINIMNIATANGDILTYNKFRDMLK